MPSAKLIITELRRRHRIQTEQIMAWQKAYNQQHLQNYRCERIKTDQLNALTAQLLLLESRLKRKQKQISNVLCQRELTILRQQKLIDALSSRLVDHGIDTCEPGGYADFDSLNDSDSAVVLEDIDSDCCNSTSMVIRRKGSGGDVTIVRSISDAIETNLKYSAGGGARRSNCFLRRPDILETVYSVEEDPEPDVAEKRDKFKNRSEKIIIDDGAAAAAAATTTTQATCSTSPNGGGGELLYYESQLAPLKSISEDKSPDRSAGGGGAGVKQVTNYNRVMSNHRSVTKPKDVKYKRINKAKSKSLEELRGRLKHWVEKGSIDPIETQHQKRAHSYA